MAETEVASGVTAVNGLTPGIGPELLPEKPFNMTELLSVLGKNWLLSLATFIVLMGAVTTYTFTCTPQYSATAQAMATYSANQASGQERISDLNTGGNYIANQIKSYQSLALTEVVLQPVITQLGLDESVTEFARHLKVENPVDTAFINITAEATSPEQAAEIANQVLRSLQKVVEQELYGENTASPIRITAVQSASIPEKPSSPKVALYLAVGFILALFAGLMAAFMREELSTKVREATDVTKILGTSPLGTVSRSKVLSEGKPVIISQPDSQIAEEIRRIRTNISFLNADGDGTSGRLIVITSTSPSEGKTMLSVNIAASLAENGAKVLLLDADLRHPSVAARLGIGSQVGLSHVLTKQVSLPDAIGLYWKKNFHILPAGKRPANAGLLLNSKRMSSLVEHLLGQYDFVLIDTAPLSVSTDATVLGRRAKGLIIVSGKKTTAKKALRERKQELDAIRVPILGFVFNFANPKRHRGSNYYHYADSSEQTRTSHRRRTPAHA